MLSPPAAVCSIPENAARIVADVLVRPTTASAVPKTSNRGAALLVFEALEAPWRDPRAPDLSRHAVYKEALIDQRALYYSVARKNG